MKQQDNKMKIFENNISTFKETSIDNDDGKEKYMIESEIKVINFDAVKKEYMKDMGVSEVPCSIDALYTNDNENYYFIEMNTRIQVEHPITEMVTGVDLIREQIRIAANQKLTYKQSDIHLNGHAIECRINAENPREGFRPCPGIVNSVHLPGGLGVRIDTTLYQGYKVSSHYDSMIAKVIVHGSNRLEAIRRMRRVLAELVIDGIDTNQELQYLILHTSEYVKGNFDTGFIENHLDKLVG